MIVIVLLSVTGVMDRITSDYTEPVSYYYEQTVVHSEAHEREPLAAELCRPLERTFETDLENVVDTDGKAAIAEAIEYFYGKTGVQPYFLLLSGIDGNASPGYQAVNDYMYDKYIELFDEDEGHLLLLMLYDEGNYTTWYMYGNDAVTVVTETDCESILDKIDYYAAESTDVAAVIEKALREAADDCMTEIEYTYETVPAGSRKKLAADLCSPLERTVETDLDVLDTDEKAAIMEAIEYFYGETGVQPCFLLLGGINGEANPDETAVNDYLYDKYVDLFGADEGHLLLLMLLNGDDYTTWYIIGDDAVNVTDQEACELLLGKIDAYAESGAYIADAVSSALRDTAAEIMAPDAIDIDPTAATSGWPDDPESVVEKISSYVPRLAVPVIVVILIAVVSAVLKKAKSGGGKSGGSYTGGTNGGNTYNGGSSYRPVNDGTGASQTTGSYTQTSGSTNPPRANYPVRCPHCGATAYPKDDGTCEYCGSRIVN